jgi:hypothetical protein
MFGLQRLPEADDMTRPVFAKTLVRAQHIRSFEVARSTSSGWEISKRSDQQVVLRQWHTDWHRVERTMMTFMREISDLTHEGWTER